MSADCIFKMKKHRKVTAGLGLCASMVTWMYDEYDNKLRQVPSTLLYAEETLAWCCVVQWLSWDTILQTKRLSFVIVGGIL